MARVQLVIPDSDRDRFVHQAKREGMTLSAWLRAAAQDRLALQSAHRKFDSVEELRAFYGHCDDETGNETEPDWEEQKKVIEEAKQSGSSRT